MNNLIALALVLLESFLMYRIYCKQLQLKWKSSQYSDTLYLKIHLLQDLLVTGGHPKSPAIYKKVCYLFGERYIEETNKTKQKRL